jgi:hypothetical protein
MHTDLPVPQRRAEARAAVSIPAAVFADGFPKPVELECTNLSSTGMFLGGNPSLTEGAPVLLVFIPPGTWHRIFIEAVVIRTGADSRGERGLGLRFGRMARPDTAVLRGALARRRAEARAWDAAVDAATATATATAN